MEEDYRILYQYSGDRTIYSIHRVFYNIYGEKIDYVKLPESLIHNDLEGLIACLQGYLEAFDKPLIRVNDFPEK